MGNVRARQQRWRRTRLGQNRLRIAATVIRPTPRPGYCRTFRLISSTRFSTIHNSDFAVTGGGATNKNLPSGVTSNRNLLRRDVEQSLGRGRTEMIPSSEGLWLNGHN